MVAEMKILVISGDPVLREFLQRTVSGRGYQLASAKDCNGQLKAVLDIERPEIIVLDVMMPAMDGIEMSLRIRQLCPTPILMLSCWGAGKDKVRRLDLGSDDYLTEPFGAAELIAQMEDVLCLNAALAEA
jgi:DNA-binding response OmpR family regulator